MSARGNRFQVLSWPAARAKKVFDRDMDTCQDSKTAFRSHCARPDGRGTLTDDSRLPL